MRGLDLLRQAKDQLEDPTRDARERLRRAAYEFLIAAVEREAWPAGFRVEVELVRAGLLALGIADGDLQGLRDVTIEQMTQELRDVCEKAERLCRSWSHGRPQRSRRRSGRRTRTIEAVAR